MSETISGVVKNGVIVPDSPLPEGMRVDICAVAESLLEKNGMPIAPREIVERVQRRAATLSPENRSVQDHRGVRLVLGEDVLALLRYHKAESVFRALLDCVCSCFPAAREIEAELQEQSEPGWIRILTRIQLPASCTAAHLRQQHRLFNERLGEVVPAPLEPLFAQLSIIAPE